MNATVSVVISTYNYGHYISAALESVLAQTHPPDEIVVVDDGSTDSTEAKVATFAGAGVRYVHQANQGAGAARNRGIAETQGDLLAFLDADDRWVPDKLARQLAHLARYPTVGLITGSEWQVYESGQAPRYIHRPPCGARRAYPEILIENTIGNPSLVLVPRSAFERVGVFDPAIPLGQDWDMWIRIARVYPIGVVDAPLIYFRQHTGSLTAGKVWQRFHANRAFYRRYISQVPALPRRVRILAAAQSMNCYYAAAALADAPAGRGAAVGMAAAALLLDPMRVFRLKAGVLARSVLGRAAFARVRGLMPRRRAPGPPLIS